MVKKRCERRGTLIIPSNLNYNTAIILSSISACGLTVVDLEAQNIWKAKFAFPSFSVVTHFSDSSHAGLIIARVTSLTPDSCLIEPHLLASGLPDLDSFSCKDEKNL